MLRQLPLRFQDHQAVFIQGKTEPASIAIIHHVYGFRLFGEIPGTEPKDFHWFHCRSSLGMDVQTFILRQPCQANRAAWQREPQGSQCDVGGVCA